MKKQVMLFLVAFLALGFRFDKEHGDLQIEWTENPEGDFSFYPKQTLSCETWCYEFAGASELKATGRSKDSIECHTLANVATHSTLHFEIVKDKVKNARIELNSVVNGKSTYWCSDGSFKIDPKKLQKRVLKASFDLRFTHPENPAKPMYWKGRIYTKVK